ncbi:MAG: serine/threonine-protein kinase [Planctomycetales bacterium]|nr:serine/threonine-protein kinase [Planctomycetales bacterium]
MLGTLGKLGPYEILEEIGRGGMGVVFRACDPKLQRIVAVKALAPELARLPSARQRFLREARAAAAVSHPHVVTIFAVEGTEEAPLGTERTTLPFLVMECIVGQTLHDKIKRVGALKVEEIIRISRQIAEGLTAAHKCVTDSSWERLG